MQADLSFRCVHEASFIVLNFRYPPNERFSSAYKLRFNVQLNRDCALVGSERVLLSTPLGVDYVVIGFDMEVQPLLVINNAA